MAGHSKWANIRRTKEREDAKRGKLFSKLAKDIVTATKLGGSGNPGENPMLKVAIDKAKAANMPNSNIDAAVDRGMGKMPEGTVIIENTYEYLLTGGVAVLVDVETDNTNRTYTDLKVIANRSGAKPVPEGSVSYQFREIGFIDFTVNKEDSDSSEIELELYDISGIESVETEEIEGEIHFLLTTQKNKLRDVQLAISEKFGEGVIYSSVELVKQAENTIDANDELIEKYSQFEDALKEYGDVVNVWSNLG